MTEHPAPASFAVPEPALPAPARRRLPRAAIVLLLALAIGLGGWWWIHADARSASTDNAYVRADSAVIAPRVKGLVAAVLVADNAHVAAGAPLVRLDDEEYAARLAAAEADLAVAAAHVTAADAAVTRLGAEARLASANAATAATAIGAADAERVRAAAERSRQRQLLDKGFATRRGVDIADAANAAAMAEAARARAALDGRAREADVTAARRGETLAAVSEARAAEARARAAVLLARQDARHTVIRAPFAGTVGDRQVWPGDYVQPGSRLLRLVSSAPPYVVANFKETQTARMLPGARAEIRVDALPDTVITGRVESVAPGSGSDFAMLPFEPGTGNFTKIVQRVPVRIRLDPGQPEVARLRSGLSAEVEVELRHR